MEYSVKAKANYSVFKKEKIISVRKVFFDLIN